jgi:hypothetical protein
MVEFFITRDKDGILEMFETEPIKGEKYGVFTCGNSSKSYELNSQLFPEITFENSPQKIKLELVRDLKNS